MTRKDYELIAKALNEARYHAIREDAPSGGAFWLKAAAAEVALALVNVNTGERIEHLSNATINKGE